MLCQEQDSGVSGVGTGTGNKGSVTLGSSGQIVTQLGAAFYQREREWVLMRNMNEGRQ